MKTALFIVRHSRMWTDLASVARYLSGWFSSDPSKANASLIGGFGLVRRRSDRRGHLALLQLETVGSCTLEIKSWPLLGCSRDTVSTTIPLGLGFDHRTHARPETPID